MSAADETLPIGTEVRSPHGTRWVKVGDNSWRVRAEWGVLDNHSRYCDHEVYGEIVEGGE